MKPCNELVIGKETILVRVCGTEDDIALAAHTLSHWGVQPSSGILEKEAVPRNSLLTFGFCKGDLVEYDQYFLASFNSFLFDLRVYSNSNKLIPQVPQFRLVGKRLAKPGECGEYFHQCHGASSNKNTWSTLFLGQTFEHGLS